MGIKLSGIGICIGTLLSIIIIFFQSIYKFISIPDTVYFISYLPVDLEFKNILLTLILSLTFSSITSYILGSKISKINNNKNITVGKIVLEANEIYKSYANGTKKLNVLINFTIKVHKGDVITIIGESGCGKSTALNIMSTLDQPDKGKIKIDSLDISKLNDINLSKIRNQKNWICFSITLLAT